MRLTIICLLASLAFATVVLSQNKNEDMAGVYKIVLDAGPKTLPAPTRYLLLKKDGSYLWGVDSTKRNPLENCLKGKWEYTSENEIKLIPAKNSEMSEVRYYADAGDGKYIYRSADKNGKKVRIKLPETTLYLQRLQKSSPK